MPDFSVRTLLPEKMDEPDVPEKEIVQALRELEIVNNYLGGYAVILDALEKIDVKKQPLIIMDAGCGGGDMLIAIAKWADKKKRKISLLGVDRNPLMTKYASENSKKYSNISFKTLNVFDETLLHEKVDITISNLFCHHFTNEELIELIKRFYKISSQAVIINDIHRHWLAYYSIKVLTSIFSKTYLVKYDAPLSVARSLTRKEWESILAEAGINNYSLQWKWAWRWQLIIKK